MRISNIEYSRYENFDLTRMFNKHCFCDSNIPDSHGWLHQNHFPRSIISNRIHQYKCWHLAFVAHKREIERHTTWKVLKICLLPKHSTGSVIWQMYFGFCSELSYQQSFSTSKTANRDLTFVVALMATRNSFVESVTNSTINNTTNSLFMDSWLLTSLLQQVFVEYTPKWWSQELRNLNATRIKM